MSNTPKNHGSDDFTAAMRDEQARGKDPYLDPKKYKTLGGESFASQEQRRLALQMVDDPEGLMTEAQRTSDVSQEAAIFARWTATNPEGNLAYRVFQVYAENMSASDPAFRRNLDNPLPRPRRRRIPNASTRSASRSPKICAILFSKIPASGT